MKLKIYMKINKFKFKNNKIIQILSIRKTIVLYLNQMRINLLTKINYFIMKFKKRFLVKLLILMMRYSRVNKEKAKKDNYLKLLKLLQID